MPKKPVRNAFYFFMKEIEPKLRKEGRIFANGMADIVPLAHPQWKSLPDSEKARFERMAKEYKASMRGLEGDKFRLDNVGNIIADRKDPVKESEKRHKKERQTVVASWTGIDIMDEVFYFINFQVLCHTEEGHYLPCELAIVEFCLRKGITRHFHKFICPGPIPTGYRFDCMNHSEQTHQIPVENFELADSNYIGLWTQIENFINYRGEKPDDPPLYCLQEDIEQTEYCLAWIAQQSCIGRPPRLKKVYDLVGMVVDLYANANHPNMSATRVHDHLNVNTWDFTRNTRCDWHEELDCKFCSLGIVRRYVFAISDSLAAVLDFTLTEKHMPSTKDDGPPCITLPPTSFTCKTKPAQSRQSRGRNPRSNWVPGRSAAPNRQQQTFKSRRDDDEDDDDEVQLEEYKTTVRRPNMPAMWTPAPKVQEQASLDTEDANEWPSLGGPAPVKFAGRVSAPDARKAPFPPDMWQSSGDHGQNFQTDQEMGSVNSYIMRQTIPLQETSPNPSFQQPALQSGHEAVIPSALGMMPGQSSTPVMGALMGQGRGRGVLGQSAMTRPPVGRGYAPPAAGRGIGRGAVPMGRGYAPPGMAIPQQSLQNLSIDER